MATDFRESIKQRSFFPLVFNNQKAREGNLHARGKEAGPSEDFFFFSRGEKNSLSPHNRKTNLLSPRNRKKNSLLLLSSTFIVELTPTMPRPQRPRRRRCWPCCSLAVLLILLASITRRGTSNQVSEGARIALEREGKLSTPKKEASTTATWHLNFRRSVPKEAVPRSRV